MKKYNAFFIIKEEGINLEVKITKTYGTIVSVRFASTEAWNNYRSFHFQTNPHNYNHMDVSTSEYIVIGGKVYKIYGLKNVVDFRCGPANGTLQTFRLDEEEKKAWLEKNKMTIILAGL